VSAGSLTSAQSYNLHAPFRVLAGASVGYFSREIFKPVESDLWFAAHYRATMNGLFEPFFLRRAGDRWLRGSQGRWALRA
jgi:hypothetical protein